MESKPLSLCGNNCFLFLALLIVVFTSISISNTFWFVGFGECQINDNYIFINLNDGLCYSNSNNENDASCTSWNTIKDQNLNNDSVTSAKDYITSHSLAITSLVFGIVLFISIIFRRFSTNLSIQVYLRAVEIILSVLIAVLLCCILAISSHTYYTNPKNYGFDSICGDELSIPFIGWFFVFASFLIALGIGGGLYAPCCGCQSDSDEEIPLVV